jgi:hypothetical protein
MDLLKKIKASLKSVQVAPLDTVQTNPEGRGQGVPDLQGQRAGIELR